MNEHKDSAQHQLAGLQARQFLDPETKEANERDVLRIIGEDSTKMTDAVRAVEIIREWGGDVSKVLAKAAERWPEVDVFKVEEKKKS